VWQRTAQHPLVVDVGVVDAVVVVRRRSHGRLFGVWLPIEALVRWTGDEQEAVAQLVHWRRHYWPTRKLRYADISTPAVAAAARAARALGIFKSTGSNDNVSRDEASDNQPLPRIRWDRGEAKAKRLRQDLMGLVINWLAEAGADAALCTAVAKAADGIDLTNDDDDDDDDDELRLKHWAALDSLVEQAVDQMPLEQLAVDVLSMVRTAAVGAYGIKQTIKSTGRQRRAAVPRTMRERGQAAKRTRAVLRWAGEVGAAQALERGAPGGAQLLTERPTDSTDDAFVAQLAAALTTFADEQRQESARCRKAALRRRLDKLNDLAATDSRRALDHTLRWGQANLAGSGLRVARLAVRLADRIRQGEAWRDEDDRQLLRIHRWHNGAVGVVPQANTWKKRAAFPASDGQRVGGDDVVEDSGGDNSDDDDDSNLEPDEAAVAAPPRSMGSEQDAEALVAWAAVVSAWAAPIRAATAAERRASRQHLHGKAPAGGQQEAQQGPTNDAMAGHWAKQAARFDDDDRAIDAVLKWLPSRIRKKSRRIQSKQQRRWTSSACSGRWVSTVIASMAAGKAPGESGVPVDIIKSAGALGHALVARIARRSLAEGTWVEGASTAVTIFLFKKGDPASPANYRPIALTEWLYRICSNCMVLLLTDWAEAVGALLPGQKGFRRDVDGTADHVAGAYALLADAQTAANTAARAARKRWRKEQGLEPTRRAISSEERPTATMGQALLKHWLSATSIGPTFRPPKAPKWRKIRASTDNWSDVEPVLVTTDFRAAFASPSHHYLERLLEAMDAPTELRQWYGSAYAMSAFRAQWAGRLSERIDVERGTAQGCPSSPLMFLLAIAPLHGRIEEVCSQSWRKRDRGADRRYVQFYADDLLFTCRNHADANEAMRLVNEFGRASGLLLNAAKCAVLWVEASDERHGVSNDWHRDGYKPAEHGRRVTRTAIKVGDETVPVVTQLTYLGVVVRQGMRPADTWALGLQSITRTAALLLASPVRSGHVRTWFEAAARGKATYWARTVGVDSSSVNAFGLLLRRFYRSAYNLPQCTAVTALEAPAASGGLGGLDGHSTVAVQAAKVTQRQLADPDRHVADWAKKRLDVAIKCRDRGSDRRVAQFKDPATTIESVVARYGGRLRTAQQGVGSDMRDIIIVDERRPIACRSPVGKTREDGVVLPLQSHLLWRNDVGKWLESDDVATVGAFDLFTDGSRADDGRVGAGAVWHGRNRSGQLRAFLGYAGDNNVGELAAVVLGVLHLRQVMGMDSGFVRVFTDSNVVVQLVKGHEVPTDLERVGLLLRRWLVTQRVGALIHTPSHVRVSGNETADKLADEGASGWTQADFVDEHCTRPEGWWPAKPGPTVDELRTERWRDIGIPLERWLARKRTEQLISESSQDGSEPLGVELVDEALGLDARSWVSKWKFDAGSKWSLHMLWPHRASYKFTPIRAMDYTVRRTALRTRYANLPVRAKMQLFGIASSGKCALCSAQETIGHLFGNCLPARRDMYTARHNRVVSILAAALQAVDGLTVLVERSARRALSVEWDVVDDAAWPSPNAADDAGEDGDHKRYGGLRPDVWVREKDGTVTALEVTVCDDGLIDTRAQWKSYKYEPLLKWIREERRNKKHKSVLVPAVFGWTGGVGADVATALKGWLGRAATKTLQEATASVLESQQGIWRHSMAMHSGE
jgi:ribonuclease HI